MKENLLVQARAIIFEITQNRSILHYFAENAQVLHTTSLTTASPAVFVAYMESLFTTSIKNIEILPDTDLFTNLNAVSGNLSLKIELMPVVEYANTRINVPSSVIKVSYPIFIEFNDENKIVYSAGLMDWTGFCRQSGISLATLSRTRKPLVSHDMKIIDYEINVAPQTQDLIPSNIKELVIRVCARLATGMVDSSAFTKNASLNDVNNLVSCFDDIRLIPICSTASNLEYCGFFTLRALVRHHADLSRYGTYVLCDSDSHIKVLVSIRASLDPDRGALSRLDLKLDTLSMFAQSIPMGPFAPNYERERRIICAMHCLLLGVSNEEELSAYFNKNVTNMTPLLESSPLKGLVGLKTEIMYLHSHTKGLKYRIRRIIHDKNISAIDLTVSGQYNENYFNSNILIFVSCDSHYKILNFATIWSNVAYDVGCSNSFNARILTAFINKSDLILVQKISLLMQTCLMCGFNNPKVESYEASYNIQRFLSLHFTPDFTLAIGNKCYSGHEICAQTIYREFISLFCQSSLEIVAAAQEGHHVAALARWTACTCDFIGSRKDHGNSALWKLKYGNDYMGTTLKSNAPFETILAIALVFSPDNGSICYLRIMVDPESILQQIDGFGANNIKIQQEETSKTGVSA